MYRMKVLSVDNSKQVKTQLSTEGIKGTRHIFGTHLELGVSLQLKGIVKFIYLFVYLLKLGKKVKTSRDKWNSSIIE